MHRVHLAIFSPAVFAIRKVITKLHLKWCHSFNIFSTYFAFCAMQICIVFILSCCEEQELFNLWSFIPPNKIESINSVCIFGGYTNFPDLFSNKQQAFRRLSRHLWFWRLSRHLWWNLPFPTIFEKKECDHRDFRSWIGSKTFVSHKTFEWQKATQTFKSSHIWILFFVRTLWTFPQVFYILIWYFKYSGVLNKIDQHRQQPSVTADRNQPVSKT